MPVTPDRITEGIVENVRISGEEMVSDVLARKIIGVKKHKWHQSKTFRSQLMDEKQFVEYLWRAQCKTEIGVADHV